MKVFSQTFGSNLNYPLFNKYMLNPEPASALNKLIKFPVIMVIVSSVALIVTFLTSISDFSIQIKLAVFLIAAFLYLSIAYGFYELSKPKAQARINNEENMFTSEVQARLLALEEASQFFGASLKFLDMFRLVSSRISEIMNFSTCVLFLPDETKTKLKIAAAVGENSRNLMNFEMTSGKGLAGKTFLSRQPQLDETLLYDTNLFPPELRKNFGSAISVPLFSNEEIFGILVIYGDKDTTFDKDTLSLFEAVSERAAPLFISSRAFERSVANALTDDLTTLPNERAFYLILENQIAEAQRYRDERSLTILSLDIKKFSGLNEQFGHSNGDRILSFTATMIKKQLRQMDFLSRSPGDEFLAVLPTASDAVIQEIIQRIDAAFESNPFVISGLEKININLNYGAATFLKDGETAQQLLQTAQLRKQQSKSGHYQNVAWFPREPAH